MTNAVQKVAVLGAGVMGSGIAALLAGTGMRVVLLDAVPHEPDEKEKALGITKESPVFRNKLAKAGLDRILNPKTGMLYRQENGALITIGNFTDNMDMIADCDWILEVVVERLDIKKQIMAQVAALRKPGSIVSTNTSGISVNAIAADMPEEFRAHFLGTHFFNPPRYMRLFEVIPAKDTLPEVSSLMVALARDTLGKGIVFAKDTPNFISNRIGIFSSMEAIRLMLCYDFDIPTADQLTGPVIGRPKSAVFRTTDMVGLDILANVADNMASNVEDAAEKACFMLPDFINVMIQSGALGNKAKRGFYTRTPKKEILYWDYKAREYKPFAPTAPEAVRKALASKNKYESIVYGEEPENKFVWELIKSLLLYSASKVPEIAEDYRMIDKAMVWGYNWEKGPFEIWDAIGLARSAERMRQEGDAIPAWVEEKLQKGETRFYGEGGELSPYICLDHKTTPVIAGNKAASLLDVGDGVLCLEFHSKGNALGGETVEIVNAAVEALRGGWRGLVIGNRGKFFSAGADLARIQAMSAAKAWDDIAGEVTVFQNAFMALKYASKPVVAAPFGMTLGGGAECVMHTGTAVAHAETYIGLVEVGVGLVPGGGGCKEFLLRSFERAGGKTRQALLPALQNTWRAIATATTSTNAFDAVDKGFMSKSTRIVMNPDALLDEAKKKVLELASDGYMPPIPAKVPLLGDFGKSLLLAELEMMRGGGFASEYDAHIATKLASILTGGNVVAGTLADESYILELEREAFVSLCGEERTQQRIAHMLTKGKPLRN